MSHESNPPPAAISDSALAAITDATMISRSPSVTAAEMNGEIVMMNIEQGRYFGLDRVGTDIWNHLDPPCTFAALIDHLLTVYDIDRATLTADARELLARMAQVGVVKLA
jgi:hypothetical protein